MWIIFNLARQTNEVFTQSVFAVVLIMVLIMVLVFMYSLRRLGKIRLRQYGKLMLTGASKMA